MRYHKRRQGRRLIGGFWHSTIDVYQKVVTMAKELSRKAIRTDIVGTQLEDGRRLKALVLARRIKNDRLQYYLQIEGEGRVWVDSENWKVIVKTKIPLEELHDTKWKGRWRGEWKLISSRLMSSFNGSVPQGVFGRRR